MIDRFGPGNIFNYSASILDILNEKSVSHSSIFRVATTIIHIIMDGITSSSPEKDKFKNIKITFDKPWDPNSNDFPSRKDLPQIAGAPDGASWFWGKNDNLGRVNLLTPARVRDAALEIKTGEIVPTSMPLNFPTPAYFGRQDFHHKVKVLVEGMAYDDIYHLNTQSGTQWDGLRHMCHPPSGLFYNNCRHEDIVGPNANERCSIHFWAEHGIAGRGVLLDYGSYAQKHGIDFNPQSNHAIGFEDLVKVGNEQGINIRPAAQGGDIKVGEILFLRTGWTAGYLEKIQKNASASDLGQDTLDPFHRNKCIGLKQETAVLDWIHDCYMAAIATDSPTFEVWPSCENYLLHHYVLPLWGMPIGELLDLEKLSETCKKQNRWSFFFASAPFNCHGGVASCVNGNAIF